MSEEDTELRDLVSQTLENNGVLAKIRAELRASVFLAVEEQESHLSKTPFVNNALKEYLSTPHGALGLCLVKEFLEYLELDFTISVFNSETQFGKDYEYEGRSKLMKDLQIRSINGKKGPLLSHILNIAQRCNESHMNMPDIKEEVLVGFKKNGESFVAGDESNLITNCLQNHRDQADSPNVSLTPLDRTYTTESSSQKHLSEDAKPEQAKAQQLTSLPDSEQRLQLQSDSSLKYVSGSGNLVSDDLKTVKAVGKETVKSSVTNSFSDEGGRTNEKNRRHNAETTAERRSQANHNPMTSLNNLPPLDGIHSKKHMKIFSSSISNEDLDIQENYEEDFQSTESSALAEENSNSGSRSHNSSNKPGKGSQFVLKTVPDKDMSGKGTESPSISEDIDHDTNSEVDDLLSSTASGENTMEATISHVTSNLADYCENV